MSKPKPFGVHQKVFLRACPYSLVHTTKSFLMSMFIYAQFTHMCNSKITARLLKLGTKKILLHSFSNRITIKCFYERRIGESQSRG